tara:strand:- start:177 stop:479 length:303 start_codon:yes stop_codon:yes gene_type:complete
MSKDKTKISIHAVKFNPKNGVVTICDVPLRNGEVIDDFLGFRAQLFGDANPNRFACIKLIDYDISVEEMSKVFAEDKDVSHLIKWGKPKGIGNLWTIEKV